MGCPKNLVDSEVLAGILEKNGYVFSDVLRAADTVIVNTCSFIKPAEDESIRKISEISKLKKARGIKALVVAGCLPARHDPGELLEMFSEADAFIGPGDILNIDGVLADVFGGARVVKVDSNPSFIYNEKHRRHLLTPRHYAYLKISEGCANRCSYCAIPAIRGGLRSRDIASIVREAENLAAGGALSEINLIAQDTTAYGTDIYGRSALLKLLKKLSEKKLSRWLRVLYMHPAHIDDELLDFFAGSASVCSYFDLPLQHVNDRLLGLMGRKVSKKHIYSLIEKLRKKIKGACIRTSLMVGFPTETEAEFRELAGFLRSAELDRVGVFKYSRQPGTAAYGLGDTVPEPEKEARYKELMQEQQRISGSINSAFVGREVEALVDGTDGGKKVLLCRTYRDAPEIDGYVVVKQAGKKRKPGDFIKVRVTASGCYDLAGEVI